MRRALKLALLCCCVSCPGFAAMPSFTNYRLDYETPPDSALQKRIEDIDGELRAKFGMTIEQAAVGVLDLRRLRLAMTHPDRIEYAASVPKVGILLAYFALHPEAATNLDTQTRHELGLMIKASSNEMAAKYSRALGLRPIQQVLVAQGFYDASHGGGIWVGKHYGQGGERIGDPVADHSHAATVRQLLRFYLLMEQGRLLSPQASATMREIFASPDIPHETNKFLIGIDNRGADILRKSGTWENWLHDTALVRAADRHYIIVALTRHARGDEYLSEFARAVDKLMIEAAKEKQ